MAEAQTTSAKTPTALIILDGWGHSETSKSNAIAAANTPTWDMLWQQQPHNLVSGSGGDVGLPDNQMGNSEVGHMNLGAGRIVYQAFTRITKSIKDGEFANNPTLVNAVEKAVSHQGVVHLFGLLSPGGVHSHEDHILAMIEAAAAKGATVYVHAFLDGRDTPPRSAEASIARIDDKLAALGCGRIASIIGRYFAMDRDQRWDRVQAAYDMLTLGEAPFTAASAAEGLAQAYARDENDEFVQATIIDGPNATIKDNDSVIFMNFRADRARQITRAFVDTNFDSFERKLAPALSDFVMLTEYSANIKTSCAFAPSSLPNVLGEHLANQGKTQLRIAETEKYAHVTFFFSGGREDLFEGEERILIPSPDVATYDLQPEMSAPELTDKLIAAIKSGKFDSIICNFANGDMVGHTGNFDAAVKAVEAVDGCLARVKTALEEVGGQCLITADHGNVEMMNNEESGQAHTAHTTEPVPLVYIGPKADAISLKSGILSDIAPTLLDLMGIKQPQEMTGSSLIQTN